MHPSSHPLLPPAPPQFALVLGSGGIKGLFHVGVYEVLHAAGLRPDLIVGCSAGSIVGSLIAADPNPEEVKRKAFELAKYATGNLRSRYHLLGMPSLAGFAGSGFFDLGKAIHLFDELLGVRTFEELQIPLCVVATNISLVTMAQFTSGLLSPAVSASCAIPGVFKPIQINNHLYVDGHVIEGVPVSPAKQRGAKCILAVNVFPPVPQIHTEPFSIPWRSLLVANQYRTQREMEEADVCIQSDILVPNILSVDAKIAQELYERGKWIAEQRIPAIREKLAKAAKNT